MSRFTPWLSRSLSLKLSNRSDGYGFLYGTVSDGTRSHNVNVLPPKSEWDGDVVLEGYQPHETDWVVYVDGEEFARVRHREDLENIGARLLAR